MESVSESTRLCEEAKVCKAHQDYGRCVELADAAYALMSTAYLAWLKIECLRKMGRSQAREAAAWAKGVQDRWGQNTWFCNSYAWAIYDGYLKFSEEQKGAGISGEEYSTARQAMHRMLNLTPDAMPRIRAVLALSDLAKDRKDWRTVEVATALLDEQTLGHEGDTFNGRRQESEFEKWSKHRVEALSKLGAGPEALALATRAVDQHSDNFWLNRLKGLCQIQGGDPAEGVKLLRRLYGLKAEWYIAGEIAAGLEALGKDLEALSWYCRACWRTAPDKAINYFPKMANLLEKNQRWEEALHHLLLSWAVSSQNSWEKRATNDLDSIKRFLSANGKHISDLPNLAQPPRLPIMVKRCREVWDEAMKFKPDLPTGTIHRFRLDENKGTISYQDRLIPFRGDDFLEGGRTPDFEEKVSFQIVEFDEVDGSGSQQWATEIMPL